MTSQAKHLKTLLQKHGIAREDGRLLVRTEKRNGCWGDAVAHVRGLTEEEVAKLTADDQYVKIFNQPRLRFAIVRW
jgi:hypothetical protein